jgi:exonuclease III
MDMTFGMWNVRSLYRAGSMKTVVGELEKHDFDRVAVQEVRWDHGSSEQADHYTFLYGMTILIIA